MCVVDPEIRICTWCGEMIEPDALRDPLFIVPMHAECGVRMIMGSIAHIEGRCSCVDPNNHETDPPELTRREAAKLAFAAWQKLGYEFPRE